MNLTLTQTFSLGILTQLWHRELEPFSVCGGGGDQTVCIFFTYCINIEKCVERAPNSGVRDITGWVTRAVFRATMYGWDNCALTWVTGLRGKRGIGILPLFHLPCPEPVRLCLFRSYSFTTGPKVPYGLFWPFLAPFSVVFLHYRVWKS